MEQAHWSSLEEIDDKRVEVSGKFQAGYGVARDAGEQHIRRIDWRNREQPPRS
jgi:hypothetical protein